jgi:hypothetical protein
MRSGTEPISPHSRLATKMPSSCVQAAVRDWALRIVSGNSRRAHRARQSEAYICTSPLCLHERRSLEFGTLFPQLGPGLAQFRRSTGGIRYRQAHRAKWENWRASVNHGQDGRDMTGSASVPIESDRAALSMSAVSAGGAKLFTSLHRDK